MGRLRYDIERGEIWAGDEPVRLTATEAQLMRIFAAQPGEALSRGELVERLGRGGDVAQERAVDVQITRLRRKIEADPKNYLAANKSIEIWTCPGLKLYSRVGESEEKFRARCEHAADDEGQPGQGARHRDDDAEHREDPPADHAPDAECHQFAEPEVALARCPHTC